MPQNQTPNQQTKLRLSLDLRLVIIVLLFIIGGMLAAWQPWSQATPDNRSISVTGEATVSAEPNEFAFYPRYEFTNSDQTAALDELTETNDQIVSGLKELGVRDSQIKTNADSRNYYITRESESDEATYTLSFTVTVADKNLAQEIQDYLLTTQPVGSITPYPTFSDSKQKELESQARNQATKDARAKAEQSAKNLGFTIGKVKSVEDGAGFGGIIPLEQRGAAVEDSAQSLTVQPGENELTYSVTVEYYLD